MKLSEIGEFGLIEKLASIYGSTTHNILRGIGDDAAAVKANKKVILATSDMLVENIHFDRAGKCPA